MPTSALADQGRASTPRRRSSRSTSRSTRPGAGAPSRVMAGLDLPGATVAAGPDRSTSSGSSSGSTLTDRRHRRDPAARPAGARRCRWPERDGDGTDDAPSAGRGASPWSAASPCRSGSPGSPRPGRTRRASGRSTVEIGIHYSHYEPAGVTVPAGVPVTIVLRNDDPIDHEWIVGDAAVHERHRTGTEPVHGSRPTEVSIPAGATPDDDRHVRHARARTCSSATCPATRRTGWSARWSSPATEPRRGVTAGCRAPLSSRGCVPCPPRSTTSRPAARRRSRSPGRRSSAAGC